MRSEEQVSISAFIEPELRDELERTARANDRSLSAELRVALREHLRVPSRYPVGARAGSSFADEEEDT